MTPEEEIFATAIALSGEARRAYLERACGADAALRENVDALLAAHASAGDFLAGSPAEAALAGAEPQPGDRLGPYTIVRKVGEGGCGLVFLAEQEAPLRRRVALKVIKPGMDSRQVIALRGRAAGPRPDGAPGYRARLRGGRHARRPPLLCDGVRGGRAHHALLR